jgi:Bacteriophage replication gene A protein (GPA)
MKKRSSYFDLMDAKIDASLDKLPRHWRSDAKLERDRRGAVDGYLSANDWLQKLTEPLQGLLDIAADDEALKALAKRVSFALQERAGWRDMLFAEYAQMLCEGYAVPLPDCEHDELVARVCCEVWWLRNLRNAHAKAREAAAIEAGIVHAKKNVYVSDDTLERRSQQLKRNASLLAGVTLKNEAGERMKLSEIAATGMANADNRRAELMTRITGFEELANKYGHKAEFITLTCPSRMHAFLKTGKANPKYDGTKPNEAQQYLVRCWARARANLAKQGVKFYGLRVVEPHHDATPHWHMILFYDGRAGMQKQLKHYITREFVKDSRKEIFNDVTPRVKFVSIVPSKGTAAGYIIKYIAKNLGGIQDDNQTGLEAIDYETGEKERSGNQTTKEMYRRVEAWAATWRIRQFQQVGGHSVTVWRELRRVVVDNVPKQLLTAWQAAQRTGDIKASFAKYIEAMGGLNVPPKRGWVRLDDDFIYTKGRYGMTILHKVRGVCERFGLAKAANNRQAWVKV